MLSQSCLNQEQQWLKSRAGYPQDSSAPTRCFPSRSSLPTWNRRSLLPTDALCHSQLLSILPARNRLRPSLPYIQRFLFHLWWRLHDSSMAPSSSCLCFEPLQTVLFTFLFRGLLSCHEDDSSSTRMEEWPMENETFKKSERPNCRDDQTNAWWSLNWGYDHTLSAREPALRNFSRAAMVSSLFPIIAVWFSPNFAFLSTPNMVPRTTVWVL